MRNSYLAAAVKVAIAGVAACLAGCGSSASDQPGDAAQSQPAATEFAFDGATSDNRAAIQAHGERLSHVLGCRGCHTPTLEGANFGDFEPPFDGIYASNLTRILPDMSDEQLERLLRTGVHPTRGDLWVMPSETFQRLSAADMTALIAHLRTIKPSGKATPAPVLSDAAKGMIAAGVLKTAAKSVADYKASEPVDLGERHAFGRYVARNTCAECHGGDLTGIKDFTPDLTIASTYSAEQLTRLLTTGEGRPGSKLGLMAVVGKDHFSYLTPRERSAVIAYVKARADLPQ
ncbi:c-type cytochrome [Flavisphingopyxis soli]|nr:c-type cytochrome [Sphingorhabdus soli]